MERVKVSVARRDRKAVMGNDGESESSSGNSSDSTMETSSSEGEEGTESWRSKELKDDDEMEQRKEEWFRLRLNMEVKEVEKRGMNARWTGMYTALEEIRDRRDYLKSERISILEEKIKMLKNTRSERIEKLQRKINSSEKMDEKRRKRELKGKRNLQIKVKGKGRQIKDPDMKN